MMCESTFIFETDQEATNAFKELESNQNVVQGWWYGKKDFFDNVLPKYIKDNELIPTVIKL